ncbi:MAG TPA: hypothetical protein VHJ69_04400, partial [Gemmatimonadales bacterium]|nr:hypothetical protein [Gemmatimonadales bacterium]
MTLARRLVVGTVFVLCLTLVALVWAVDRSFRRRLEAELAGSLEREARLVQAALPADSALWPATVQQLAGGTGHRIVLARAD